MLSRRRFLTAAASTCALPFGSGGIAADALVPTAAVAQPKLTPTEQLMYATVRLFYRTPTQTKWGTAFFFNFFKTETASVPALVTNRHVVEDMASCSFILTARADDGTPDLSKQIPITLSDFQNAWLPHPSADLAIIPVARTINGMTIKPYFVSLDQSLIPTEDQLKDLTPVEQVLTIGFPGAIWDDVHNLPVFHRGYTATAPYIEFKGQKEFLIDFTTWPGASGSPVLLYNEGTWLDRRGHTIMGGIRAKLLGVVFGVAQQDISGNVIIQAGPTGIAAAGHMSVPTNLGACIMSSQILDFEPLLVSKGVTLPSGYKMRARP